MPNSIVLIRVCVITSNNVEQLKTTMSAEKQLFIRLCLSITGQIWQLKGNLVFNLFIALDSFAI